MPDEPVPETIVVTAGSFEGAQGRRAGTLITDAAALRPQRMVVDMRDTPTVDATAIAILLQAHRAMGHMGGRLVLRRPTDRVLRMLHISRSSRCFEIEGVESTEVDPA